MQLPACNNKFNFPKISEQRPKTRPSSKGARNVIYLFSTGAIKPDYLTDEFERLEVPWFACASERSRHKATWRSRGTSTWRHDAYQTAVYRCRRTDTWTVAGGPLAPTDSTPESCPQVF